MDDQKGNADMDDSDENDENDELHAAYEDSMMVEQSGSIPF